MSQGKSRPACTYIVPGLMGRHDRSLGLLGARVMTAEPLEVTKRTLDKSRLFLKLFSLPVLI